VYGLPVSGATDSSSIRSSERDQVTPTIERVDGSPMRTTSAPARSTTFTTLPSAPSGSGTRYTPIADDSGGGSSGRGSAISAVPTAR
jgi:hypothetical protein